MSPTRKLLRTLFFSDDIWGEIAKVFTQPKAVDTIRALSGEEHDSLIELCCSYLTEHSW